MHRSALCLLPMALALAACGPTTQHPVPGLPGSGTENFASDGEAAAGGEPEVDPWAERELIESPPASEPRAVELPPVERFTLQSGLEVIAVRDPSLPVVSMQLAVKAGNREVSREKVGLAGFVASMLPRGTRRRSAREIAEAIDFVGGSLGANASYEATLVSCKVLSKDLGTCLKLVPEIVAHPSFPKDEMDIVRKDLLQRVRQRRDDAGQLANAHFQNFLWGAEHVRGWPMSAATIDNIRRADLVAWHKKWVRPNNAILAIAGDIDPSALKARLERSFRPWRRSRLPERPSYTPPTVSGIKVRLVDKPDQTQSHIRVGHLGIAHGDPAFYAALVMNYTLGGGAFSSRLLTTVRSVEGKTYTASSSFDKNREIGAFVAATFTRTGETVSTVRLVLEELRKMHAGGPTAAEVQDAITYLAGSYATRFETGKDVAGAILAADLHELGDEYVKRFPLRVAAVEPAAATRAAKRMLHPQNLVVVIVGNAAEVEPQLHEAGWVYEKVGHLEPVAPWEREQEVSRESEPADEEAVARARAILDKALAAKGGAQKLKKLRSFSWKGDAELTLPAGKTPAKVQKRFLAPDKLRLDMKIGGGQVEVATVLDGDEGWARQQSPNGDQTIDFPAAEVKALKAQVWREQDLVLARYRDEGTAIEPLGERKLGGRKHHAIRVIDASGARSVVLLIDAETLMLGAMEYAEQGSKARETFGDYRKVGGIQIAHKRETKSDQLQLVVELTEVKVGQKVSPRLFEKPEKKK